MFEFLKRECDKPNPLLAGEDPIEEKLLAALGWTVQHKLQDRNDYRRKVTKHVEDLALGLRRSGEARAWLEGTSKHAQAILKDVN